MNRQRRASTATSPTGSTRMPSTGCRSTSMPSCGGPGRSASARHGRASKGGSLWTRHFASRRVPGLAWVARARDRLADRPGWSGHRRRRVALDPLACAVRACSQRRSSCRARTATSSPWTRSLPGNRRSITGPAFDFGATFSRDGTKFIFLRGSAVGLRQADCGLILMVANADGSGVRALTPGLPGARLAGLVARRHRRSPSPSRAPDGNGHVIDVVNVDGSGMRTLDVGRPAHELSWLPPDGREIVFRGEQLQASDPPSGIFAVHPDGTELHADLDRPGIDRTTTRRSRCRRTERTLTYQSSGPACCTRSTS